MATPLKVEEKRGQQVDAAGKSSFVPGGSSTESEPGQTRRRPPGKIVIR
jgi:hypothetical protein